MIQQSELARLALRYGKRQGMNATPLAGLQVARSNRKTAPEYTVLPPCVCLIVQGEKEIALGETRFHYDPHHYLVTSVAVPLVGQVTVASPATPFLSLVLTLDQGVIYDTLTASTVTPSVGTEQAGGVFVEKVRPALSDAFCRLLGTLDDPDELRSLAPLYLREITYRLLTSPYSASVQQVGVAGSHVQRISKAIELLRERFTEPLSVADLARTSRMSRASFHQHFRQVTTMSPLQFQKQLRLHEARRLLLASDEDAATAGFQVGYQSPSQFSREYARLFGLPPRADRRRFLEDSRR